jgi:hypothetical protein
LLPLALHGAELRQQCGVSLHDPGNRQGEHELDADLLPGHGGAHGGDKLDGGSGLGGLHTEKINRRKSSARGCARSFDDYCRSTPMKLLTKEIEANIPALYCQDGQGDNAVVYVKFFCPWNKWTWYGTEYDPEERMFFGYVFNGADGELGYFSLDELESVRGPFGLKIERDRYFGTPKLGEVLKG